ncbi:MAG TPA: hypothetical protein VG032_00715 [Acidimicrobiales bacterium]|nr:hypothetical protein [Acidimicrobiales bacterium]
MTHTRSGAPPGPTDPVSTVGTRTRATPAVVRPEVAPEAPSLVPPDEGAAPDPAPATPATTARIDPPPAPARPRPDDRRAQRAARRHRRRLAAWCAVLVAFCLAVTILIVTMAGNRTPGPQAIAAVAPASPPAAAPTGVSHPMANRGAEGPGRGRR